jgi:hypothetical protein
MGIVLLLLLLGVVTLLASAGWLAAEGFRNGDRQGDVTVTAELRDAGQPDEPRPVVIAELRNPSGTPAMAALSARPARVLWWATTPNVTVPRRTARYGLRASRYDTVGVVPAGGSAQFAVPVGAGGRRYRLVVVIGQGGGRLRVHTVGVDGRSRIWQPVTDLTGWRRTS